MDKHKAKNIALGVSLALNVLGSLLIGGALIKSCNTPENAGNASLSVSNAEKVNLYDASKTKALLGLGTSGGDDEEESSSETPPNYPYITGARWQFNEVANNFLGTSQFRYLSFVSNGENFVSLTYRKEGSICNIVYFRSLSPNEDSITPMTSAGTWISDAYRTIEITNDYYENSSALHNFLTNNAVYLGNYNDPEYSSSEQSSSEETTSDDTSSSIVETPTLITFPNDYNPLVAFGYVSDGLIGQLAGNKTSPFTLPMSFVSGGYDFKAVKIYFLSAQGLEYLPQGSSTTATFSGEGYVYPMTMYYVDVDDNLLPAWRCVYGVKNDGNVYMRNYGEWLSTEYQRIEVIDYEPQFDISGLAPSLDQVGLLSLRTAHGDMTPVLGGNGNYDVFTLIGSAFNGIIPILEIQLLPYLTIGTLLFVPLVVLLIFAILKVLNK